MRKELANNNPINISINTSKRYVIEQIKEQRREQEIIERQKKYFLEESDKVFKENGIEQILLENVENGSFQPWLRYSQNHSYKEIKTSSGTKLKKIKYTPALIITSDKSIAKSLIYGEHWHVDDVPSINEIKVSQNERGEFMVSGYKHEYTVDGYHKDTRFEESTALKGKQLIEKISSLINESILAVSVHKNK